MNRAWKDSSLDLTEKKVIRDEKDINEVKKDHISGMDNASATYSAGSEGPSHV